MNYRPLTGSEVVMTQLRSIVRSLGRIVVQRLHRTASVVASEYDEGYWARMCRGRAWEKFTDVEDFLVSLKKDRFITAKVGGVPSRISAQDYYRLRDREMGRMIDREFADMDEIVEIGCGYGHNLFALAHALPGRKFYGFDISEWGISAARQIADHFGLSDRVMFEVIDLTQGGPALSSMLRGRGCFSFFCIEQIPGAVDAAIANIRAARPRRVLHVEPTGWLLSDKFRFANLANILYVLSVHYQTRLFLTLKQLAAEGKVRLLTTGIFPFAPTLQNDGYMALWEPGGDEAR